MILNTLPIEDGFRMPGEFEPHEGCFLIWPHRGDSWPYGGDAARNVFRELVRLISRSEVVFVCVPPSQYDKAKDFLPEDIELIQVNTDDSWARDYAPTFVKKGNIIRGVNWCFNAWGGNYDGLYDYWANDDNLCPSLCTYRKVDIYDAHHFVMEGGAIHSDGRGTLITTESCLLSPGRNPRMTKTKIEENLKNYLGASKVIWLPEGIVNDETNGHVDNICAFTSPGHVVLAFPEDKSDAQYEPSRKALEVLKASTDAEGNPIEVHLLPMPKPCLVTEYELDGLELLNGEPVRIVGERLAASYANFYIANKTVIVPGFDDDNDEVARSIIADLFPDREVVTLQSREVLIGGGNFHCLTQQIPKAE